MRGHGFSDGRAGDRLTLDRLTRDARQVGQALCGDSFTLLTHSYGGFAGLELIRRRDELPGIRALHAYAPPWRHRKQSIKSLPKNYFKTWKVILRFRRHCGFGAWRTPARQDYHLHRDMPDFHEPMMHREIRAISLRRYARLLLRMRMDIYRRTPNWSVMGDLPVHLHLARNDRTSATTDSNGLRIGPAGPFTGWNATTSAC